MMMAEIRGSWTLEEAIVQRWEDAGLNAGFRKFWSSGYDEYPVLHDGEPAWSQAPGPYCVYEIMRGAIVGHDSGKTSTEFQQQQRITVRFHIHTENSATQTGKSIGKSLASSVAGGFDSDFGALWMRDDRHIQTDRGPDYAIKEDETHWEWVLEFDFMVDCAYDLPI